MLANRGHALEYKTQNEILLAVLLWKKNSKHVLNWRLLMLRYEPIQYNFSSNSHLKRQVNHKKPE